MTENEAIKKIRDKACNDRCMEIHCDDSCMYGECKCAFQIAIQALEEIKQYRAIEERLKKIYGKCDGLLETVVSGLERHEDTELPSCIFKSRLLTDEDVDMWDAYRAIGTPAEMKQNKIIADKRYDYLMDDIELLKTYASIGTPDECKSAVERMRPRKVVNKKGFIIAKDKGGNEFYEANPYCPSCNTPIDNGGTAKGVYCKWCGQRFDWSE